MWWDGRSPLIHTEHPQRGLNNRWRDDSGTKNMRLLGRGGRNRRSQNPGIAKKGGGGLTPAKIFWWICWSIPKTLLRHHSAQIMITYPPKSEHFSPKIDHHQQLVNIYPKSNHSLPKMVIYALLWFSRRLLQHSLPKDFSPSASASDHDIHSVADFHVNWFSISSCCKPFPHGYFAVKIILVQF